VRTFRPAFAVYRRRFLLLAGILAFDVLLQLVLFQSARLLPLAILLALTLAYTALYYRNSRVEAAPGTLAIRNALGIEHFVAPSHVATVVIAEHLRTGVTFGTEYIPRLFVLDDDGRSVLRWSSNRWTVEQMQDLAAALGVTVAIVPEALSPAEFGARYPRALGWVEAHPVVTGLLIAAVLVAIVALVILDPIGLPF
jgi:hypothetical protein